MKRLLISAAEPSGDQLGAALVHALQQRENIEAFGLAGPAMREAGVEPVARMEPMCAMGVVEVLQKLPAIHNTKRALESAMIRRPDALLVIDAPDLHLPIARKAKKHGIPVIGWVCPQVWAWRPDRVHTVSKSIDTLLCLFDFEPDLFPEVDAHWFGHPVVDRLSRRNHVDPDLFGLTPGSRKSEVDRIWPRFIETAEEIRKQRPNARFRVVSPVDNLQVPLWIERASTIHDLSTARAVLTKSGTITLELAVMGIPQVVAHRVHPLTYGIGKQCVRGISHIAMPNILSRKEVVPEFIQDLNPAVLAAAVLSLPSHQTVDLRSLGAAGAIDRTADHVLKWIPAA